MTTLRIIERQLLARQAAEKAKAAPDLAAVVKRAVNEALAEAGVVTTPAPQPPQSPRITRWTRPARTYAPPPDHALQARTEPAPLPLVVPPPAPRAAAAPRPLPKQLRVQRDELGLLKSVYVEPGGPTFTVQRDELGRIDLLLIDGKPTQRWLYGADGETVVGTVPADHPPTRYNGRAVPPASLNARST